MSIAKTTGTDKYHQRSLVFSDSDRNKCNLPKEIKNEKINVATISFASVQSINISESATFSGSLRINKSPNLSISIPNIANRVIEFHSDIIYPHDIRNNKVFIINNSQEITIKADESCDGIEIILYNNSIGPINITYINGTNTVAIDENLKMIFIDILNKWIIN